MRHVSSHSSEAGCKLLYPIIYWYLHTHYTDANLRSFVDADACCIRKQSSLLTLLHTILLVLY